MFTKDYLHEIFEYKNGNLYWKKRIANCIFVDKKAGFVRKDKYVQVKINWKAYLVHRIIFMMFHGYMPKTLDHINGNKSDNRIENLREATSTQNSYNKKLRKDSLSGIKNVTWSKVFQKYQVRIQVDGKRKSIGYFKDINSAKLAAEKARIEHHKQFARHK